jgi:hypothetical protein
MPPRPQFFDPNVRVPPRAARLQCQQFLFSRIIKAPRRSPTVTQIGQYFRWVWGLSK